MKLAIMQPYFFPYIGYFQLIQSTDHFIFFDIPQYERHGWMNRNRIINVKDGSSYIIVPTVKVPQQTPLTEIRIDETQDWRKRIVNQLDIYKKRAPYYNDVMTLVQSVIEQPADSLVELNVLSIKKTCEYIEMPFKYEIFSHMELDIPSECEPDEWALMITKALGFNTYINAPGGMSFFDRNKYLSAGISLKFIQPNLTPYVQKIGRFESGLSIIDVMMFNSKNRLREMLYEYELA
jgi:hypothetical protein